MKPYPKFVTITVMLVFAAAATMISMSQLAIAQGATTFRSGCITVSPGGDFVFGEGIRVTNKNTDLSSCHGTSLTGPTTGGADVTRCSNLQVDCTIVETPSPQQRANAIVKGPSVP